MAEWEFVRFWTTRKRRIVAVSMGLNCPPSSGSSTLSYRIKSKSNQSRITASMARQLETGTQSNDLRL
jgi:hypothetical protein